MASSVMMGPMSVAMLLEKLRSGMRKETTMMITLLLLLF
jgi:hypothetical protein